MFIDVTVQSETRAMHHCNATECKLQSISQVVAAAASQYSINIPACYISTTLNFALIVQCPEVLIVGLDACSIYDQKLWTVNAFDIWILARTQI